MQSGLSRPHLLRDPCLDDGGDSGAVRVGETEGLEAIVETVASAHMGDVGEDELDLPAALGLGNGPEDPDGDAAHAERRQVGVTFLVTPEKRLAFTFCPPRGSNRSETLRFRAPTGDELLVQVDHRPSVNLVGVGFGFTPPRAPVNRESARPGETGGRSRR